MLRPAAGGTVHASPVIDAALLHDVALPGTTGGMHGSQGSMFG